MALTVLTNSSRRTATTTLSMTVFADERRDERRVRNSSPATSNQQATSTQTWASTQVGQQAAAAAWSLRCALGAGGALAGVASTRGPRRTCTNLTYSSEHKVGCEEEGDGRVVHLVACPPLRPHVTAAQHRAPAQHAGAHSEVAAGGGVHAHLCAWAARFLLPSRRQK